MPTEPSDHTGPTDPQAQREADGGISPAPDTDAPTPFHDLASFVGQPRLTGLTLSPDGSRLVASVATLDADKTAYVTSLWELDPAAEAAPRRLTRGAKGESAAAFTADGDLLFAAGRPGATPGDDDDDSEVPALWLLPRGGGESRLVARRPGGVGGLRVARNSGTLVLGSATLPSAVSDEDDAKAAKERKDKKVSAILHESYPIRHWDHDLGPAFPHLFWAGQLPPDESADPEVVELRDLTPDAAPPSGAGDDVALSSDGRQLVRSEEVSDGPAGRRSRVVLTDTGSGRTRVLVDDPLADVYHPRFSPDGGTVVCVRESLTTYADPPDYTLVTKTTPTPGPSMKFKVRVNGYRH